MFFFTEQNSQEAEPAITNRKLPKVPEFQERDYNIIYEEMENTSETYMEMDGSVDGGTYENIAIYNMKI